MQQILTIHTSLLQYSRSRLSSIFLYFKQVSAASLHHIQHQCLHLLKEGANAKINVGFSSGFKNEYWPKLNVILKLKLIVEKNLKSLFNPSLINN